MPRSVDILVPAPVDTAYSYAVPDGMDLAAGDYVDVPLGSRQMTGVVWSDTGSTAGKKLKAVAARHDLAPLPDVHRRFIDWVAHYTMTPKGAVLKMTLSAAGAMAVPEPVAMYRMISTDATRSPMRKPTTAQAKVAKALGDGTPRRLKDLMAQAGVTSAVIKGMVKAGLVETVAVQPNAPCAKPAIESSSVVLSAAQDAAARTLRDGVRKGGYHAALIDGVTGAGKTEVYFEAIAEALQAGGQALLLLPEIALSNAFIDRFVRRFGCRPALWHSALTPAQRRQVWRGAASGETRVVVGARSALFLPFARLGLIVVDEEHDPAYKQEDKVIYHARDMAVVRAHLGGFPIVLVSATPSLETMANAWAGRYAHIHLPDRHGGATLPEIRLIDLKADRLERQRFIAPTVRAAVVRTLQAGEQALLFLNRRGYAPLTLCRTCGYRFNCPNCTAWLVEHKHGRRLRCHHCDFGMEMPATCPSCGDTDSFAPCGPGVERVFEEASALFPDARIVVLASDTAEDPEALRRILQDIRDHRYDIVIGTQIIAKGHHFPKLTLVAVIDADIGLSGGDLRAAERTYQLLHQVAGRAGREDRPGTVFLQTFYPENKVMQALTSHERDAFMDAEAQEREAAHMPPYARLAALIVSGDDEDQVRQVADDLGRTAPHATGVDVFGPAEATFYRLRGHFRRRLLVRADKDLNIQGAIEAWLAAVRVPSSVRVYVDIDPQSFL